LSDVTHLSDNYTFVWYNKFVWHNHYTFVWCNKFVWHYTFVCYIWYSCINWGSWIKQNMFWYLICVGFWSNFVLYLILLIWYNTVIKYYTFVYFWIGLLNSQSTDEIIKKEPLSPSLSHHSDSCDSGISQVKYSWTVHIGRYITGGSQSREILM
jgi:hypothetical protein